MTNETNYKFFGVDVPEPPQGKALPGQKYPEDPKLLVEGNTVPLMEPQLQTLKFINVKEPEATHNLKLISSNNWQKQLDGRRGWICEGRGVGSIAIAIKNVGPISGAYVKIKYREWGTGTKKGTAVGVSLNYKIGDNSQSHAVSGTMNTRQLEEGTWCSPSFSLGEADSQTLVIDIYVARKNWLTLHEISLVVPEFTPVPYKVYFYWKCIGSLSIPPGQSGKKEEVYQVGTSTESSSTESIARELGLSASVSYGAISAEMSASIAQSKMHTETVTVIKENTQTTTLEYKNEDKEKTQIFTLWQPCIEYQFGSDAKPLKLIEEIDNSLVEISSFLSK